MPDNWSYVFSAYGVGAGLLIGYWRHLARRLKRLANSSSGTGR
jgi:hypothetical protein